MNAQGPTGGLVLQWNEDLDLKILKGTNNFIDVVCCSNGLNKSFYVTFVCGCSEESSREEVQNSIAKIGEGKKVLHAALGDFNAILSLQEKTRKRPINQAQSKLFHNFLDQCGILDLESKGLGFTWSNKQKGKKMFKRGQTIFWQMLSGDFVSQIQLLQWKQWWGLATIPQFSI